MHKAILLFGGNSDERLVSVASAQNLSGAYQFDELWFIHFEGPLSRVGPDELALHEKPFVNPFKAKEKPFAKSIQEALPSIGPRVVFLGLHGTEGEDGSLQGLFEKNQVLFTGSGAESSRNCFDKVIAKSVVRKQGLKLADELILKTAQKKEWAPLLKDFFQKNDRKIVLKPIASGSSFGLHIIASEEQLSNALGAMSASSFGDYLAEAFLQGRELTVGVFEESGDVKALPPSEVVLNAGFSFDYEGKYLGRGTTEITSAKLTLDETARAQELAVKSHKALGCRGYSRTDMILTAKGPVFLETNTLPGLSKASFVPQQLNAAGMTMKGFVEDLLVNASERYRG